VPSSVWISFPAGPAQSDMFAALSTRHPVPPELLCLDSAVPNLNSQSRRAQPALGGYLSRRAGVCFPAPHLN